MFLYCVWRSYPPKIVTELINNSLDAVKDNDNPFIAIYSTRKNNLLTLIVQDNGHGFKNSTSKNPDENIGGFGSGLIMIKKLCEKINAEFEYGDNTLGAFAKIAITLN